MANDNDLIKIKEDAIKIQEADIADTIKSIESENTKSSFVLGFAAVLFGIVFDKIGKIPNEVALTFLLLLLLSVSLAFWNISAKKIKIHTNVDEVFVKNKPDDWKEYLNCRHLRLREIYSEANKLLYQKASLTRLAFILLILSVLLFSIARIFYGRG
ncbi:MAG: hypothetical protein WHU95_01625 [candidate division WOR-3 bacterium]|nr:hypothetical protein [candidate division WOR-3 bacterium]MDH7518385.1 hypothetical protein [bacterium]